MITALLICFTQPLGLTFQLLAATAGMAVDTFIIKSWIKKAIKNNKP